MNLVTHKFSLKLVDEQVISIPGLMRLLPGVHDQFGTVVIYALVDTTSTAAPTDVNIIIAGTGHQLPDATAGYGYFGTVKMSNGHLMWHVFSSNFGVK
jgi:hypothetical protein